MNRATEHSSYLSARRYSAKRIVSKSEKKSQNSYRLLKQLTVNPNTLIFPDEFRP